MSLAYWAEITRDIGTPTIALIAAWIGLTTYRGDAATRRADLLAQLHKDFFVTDTYKLIRTKLDDDSAEGEATRAAIVQDEDENFTDFLNFFEMNAYFVEIETFKRKDLDALLGYYLRLLKTSPSICNYICDPAKGFEHLRKLLGKMKP